MQPYGKALLALALGATSAEAQFGTNLILNHNAEAGAIGTIVPNWTTTGGLQVRRYEAVSGDFPSVTDPGPTARGLNFFSGGSGPASSMVQTLSFGSLTGVAPRIAAGTQAFTFSAYLGGFATQADNATFTATFLNASNTAIGTFVLGPVTAADRGNATGLLLRLVTGFVPIGSESVRFTLDATRAEGVSNDGYADELSFVLANNTNVVPEPATTALFASGLLMLGGVARARRKAAR
jgi:hypothetical protein